MYRLMKNNKFNKLAFLSSQLLELLISRGLLNHDIERTERYLKFIGYYRLSAYFLPYQNATDKFKNNIFFDDILNLYIQDRKLKTLIMDAMERVEVAIRSSISNFLSCKIGSHWYLDRERVFVPEYYTKIINKRNYSA
jgi:abortive infection bacteriophage resistance protein